MFQILLKLPGSSAWEKTPVLCSGIPLHLTVDIQSLVKKKKSSSSYCPYYWEQDDNYCFPYLFHRIRRGEEENEELQVDEAELWPLPRHNLWSQEDDWRRAVWDESVRRQQHWHVTSQPCLSTVRAGRWVFTQSIKPTHKKGASLCNGVIIV